MRIENILPVAIFLLAILMIGAASASDDADTLAVDNGTEETLDVPMEDVGDECNQLSSDEDMDEIAVDDGEDYSSFGGYIYVSNDVCYDDPESTVVYVDDLYLDGDLTIVIDDNDTYKRTFIAKNKEHDYVLAIKDLKKIPSHGLHKVNVTYKMNGVETPVNVVKNVDFTYYFYSNLGVGYYITWDEEDVVNHVYCGRDIQFDIYLPNDAKGKLEVMFNDRKYEVTVKKGKAHVTISKKDVKPGNNTITYTFLSSLKKYPKKTVEAYCVIEPDVLFNNKMAVGEKDTIDIISTKGTNVSVKLINEKNNQPLGQYSFNGDKLSIPLENLIHKGKNQIRIVFEIGNVTINAKAFIDAQTNSKGFKASISSKANFATVKLTGPKIKANVKIYADHKLVKSVSLKKGKISYKVSNLGLGKHNIKVLFQKGKKFFSKTFSVNVKYYVKLKGVKVKKSAKKLVLSATVKTTKKVKKGLKVTFKFNGKKYSAKTNAKGVAKVTVKKSVLKKLKVGKKVKYQATYLKHTVKKTAKVKR